MAPTHSLYGVAHGPSAAQPMQPLPKSPQVSPSHEAAPPAPDEPELALVVTEPPVPPLEELLLLVVPPAPELVLVDEASVAVDELALLHPRNTSPASSAAERGDQDCISKRTV